MSRKIQKKGVPSFGHFLEYLRLNKFSVGVAHYARAQHVLDRVGEDFRPDDPESLQALKPLLRPIFAASEKEQDKFSALYDDYVEYCRKTVRVRKGVHRGSGGAGPDAASGGDGQAEETGLRGLARRALDGWRRLVRSKPSRKAIAAIVLALAVLAAAIYLLSTRQPGPSEVVKPDPAQATPTPTPVSSQPPPPPPPLPTPIQPPDTPRPPPIFYLTMAAAMLMLVALYRLLRRGLRALDPRSYENKKPPFKWSLRAAAPAVRLYDSEAFRRATRLLRRRQVDEFFRLDLGATVSATIRSLGYPTFRYKPATRVSEYLVLIERASPHDHQARLFDELVKSLRREGLIVSRYFYKDDPLVCCDSHGENCVRLERLKQRHAGHQLILFGNGEHLLDPMTGRLTEQAAVLFDWHNRAVVTPESDWGWREQVLSEKFVVVSADVPGLLALANSLESPEMRSSLVWHPADPHSLPRANEDSQTLDALRSYLSPQTFQWLCACAVYTELRWELTLLLGALPSMPQGMVNEDSLLRMSRLPWFRKGSIPESVRVRLIKALDPARLDQTREAIIKLLETDPPPPGTFASDVQGLELTLQRWLLHQDKKSLGELRGALKRLPPRQVSRSEVMSHFLKTVPHKFFGRRLPGMFYRGGIPTLGLNALARAVFSLALVAAALVALRVWVEDVPRWAYAPFVPAAATSTPGPTPAPTAPPTPTNTNTNDNANSSDNANTGGDTNANEDGTGSGANINRRDNTNGNTGGGTTSPTPAGKQLYRGTIDEDIRVDDEVRDNIDPVLKENPRSVIYLISGENEVAERIAEMIREESETSNLNIVILDTGDPQVPEVEVVIKPEGDPPPAVPKTPLPKTSLPEGARKVGEFNYPQHSDDADHDAGNLSILTDMLRQNPKAYGYLVANKISNGRLGENRFDIYTMESITGTAGDRVSVVLEGDSGDKDVSMYIADIAPPRKLDEYTGIGWGDETTRLDNYAIALQNDPAAQAFMICYSGRRDSAEEAIIRCDRAKDYLKTRGLELERLVYLHGGYRESSTIELWVVPPGSPFPESSPTIDPSEIQSPPRPTRRRRGRR